MSSLYRFLLLLLLRHCFLHTLILFCFCSLCSPRSRTGSRDSLLRFGDKINSAGSVMADRVHPNDSPPQPQPQPPPPPPPRSTETDSPRKPVPPPQDKPVPQPVPGTYVIQIPKDQIYRVPPPEKEGPSKRRPRREKRRPRRCCCCTLAVLAALLVLLAAAAGVFYLVVRPQSPHYSVSRISIGGLNLTSSAPVSPEMDVSVWADNPNFKIGIDYLEGSSVEVYYGYVNLCGGALPAFYQPANNATVFDAALKGGARVLATQVREGLASDQSQGRVPLTVKVTAPVKLKLGALRTWKITVKVTCDVTVDKLTATAKIGSRECEYGVDIF